MSRKRVVIGMSGGVDSSVAAYLLKEQGFEVIGITMQVWQDDTAPQCSAESGCCGLSAVDDARSVATALGIPYYVLNFKQGFKKHVIDYFIDEYRQGRTPNPCIACNRYVKWEMLLNKAIQLGADYIATGHYARIEGLETGRLTLRKSKTLDKDQTYALYGLTQAQLKHTLMPVGEYTKDEVRQIAKDIGLNTADKPDSQEICFVPDKDYGGFIERETGVCPSGDFVDQNGNVLGKHRGIIHYTVGQRKNLGISVGSRIYVKAINPATNQVILADDENLFSQRLYAEDINFMSLPSLTEKKRLNAKIRYNHKGADCVAHIENNRLICSFDKPQRAITPGQAVVLYDGEYLACGGVIVSQ